MEKFQIVRIKSTGEEYLSRRYFLDPQKFTLFCEYKKEEEPVFEQWALCNEYDTDVEVVGDYITDNINFSWRGGITYK